MRAKVGAMPQPKSSQPDHEQTPGRGANARTRVQSGMSLENLKRQTAYRLAQERSPDDGDDESSDNNTSVVDGDVATEQIRQATMHYQAQHPHQSPGHPLPREPPAAAGSTHLVGAMSPPPQNSYPSQQRGGGARDYAPSYGGPAPYDIPPNYSNESTRNYTDSQLGIGGGHPSHGNMTQLAVSSPPPPQQTRSRPLQPTHPQPLPQQYSTPRMPRRATVLKDRGSAENSVGSSDPSGGSDGMGYGYGGGGRGGNVKTAPPSLKGRAGSHVKSSNKAGGKASLKTPQQKEMRSPLDGRHTPVRGRNNLEGQILFATPNQRRDVPSTPTSVYSEPQVRCSRNHRLPHHQNTSPNYNRMRSPDHHAGNYSKGGNGGGSGRGFYSKNHQLNKHQSKLPHGLTVQELKEMTRARLATEAEVGGPEGANGSSDLSVHSSGTHGSSKGSADQFSLQGRGAGSIPVQSNDQAVAVAVTRNLVRDNEFIRQRDYSSQGGRNSQGFGQGQQQQMQQQQNAPPQYNNYPRHPSPVFGAGPAPLPNHFNNGNNQPPGPPRQTSPPPYALNSSQTRSQGEAWETASAASTEYPESGVFHTGNNSAGGGMPFASPMRDSNAMRFNRGRCFSAGATAGIPSSSFEQSFEQQHQAMMYYETSAPLTTGGTTSNSNRQRCATVSPPGMSRLHEDRPFLFSTNDKERLAIPPLSEPRLRLHSTGGLNTHGTAMRAFHMSPPPTNLGRGSAFVPIAGKANDQFLPQSPPPLSMDRGKFKVGDRAMSAGSATSGHGDLPSYMAEAVLESITSTTAGAPIGGKVIGHASPFRSNAEREMVGELPFRVGKPTESSSDNTLSAFRMDTLLPESSGSMSLFSSGESARNLFSETSGERMLLGTHSWGGAGEGVDTTHSDVGFSHDFSNLLNLSNGPALRGRASTEPVWFGGNDPLFVSRIDPEHNNGEQTKDGPPLVSSDGMNAHSSFNGHFK